MRPVSAPPRGAFLMEHGWSSERHAFVQQYGEPTLDASLLKMVQVGFISAHDPMRHDTMAAMGAELVSDSLVYRYDPAASPDGLRGSESTFSLCTFLYVDALAREGRLDEARLTFEQLGNFPLDFTHLALIDAAMILNERLDGATARTKRTP